MKVVDLLDSPEKWTQGALARDKNGYECAFDSTEAVCRCLVGWVIFCYRVNDADPLWKLFQAIRKAYSEQKVTSWNDAPERTFAEIRPVLVAADV